MRRFLLSLIPLSSVALFLLLLGRGTTSPVPYAEDRFILDGKPVATIGIPVSRPFVPDQTRLDECAEGRVGEACREQAFGNLSANSGPEAALAIMLEGLRSGSVSPDECHMVAHAIGSGAMVYFDGDFSRVISVISPYCSDGYLHGSFQPLFSDLPVDDQAAFVERILEVCREGITPSEVVMGDCAHGAGHAVMLRSGFNLPLAIKSCVGAWPSGRPYVQCLQGVFMENFIPSYGIRSPWLKKDDLLYPCGSFANEDIDAACYVQAGDRLTLTPGLTIEGYAKICADLSGRSRGACLFGLGRTVAFREAARTGIDPLELCEVAASYGGAEICVAGYAVTEVRQTRGLVEPASASASSACRRASAATIRHACWWGIGRALFDNGGAEIFDEGFDAEARCREEGIDNAEDVRSCASGLREESLVPGTPAW